MEYLLEGIVLAISIILVAVAVYSSRKNGKKEIPWDKIRPILTTTFARIKEVQDAKSMGYQAIEDFAVLLVKNEIKKANFLSEFEKTLISDDLIRSIIGPRLKEIYEEKSGK